MPSLCGQRRATVSLHTSAGHGGGDDELRTAVVVAASTVGFGVGAGVDTGANHSWPRGVNRYTDVA